MKNQNPHLYNIMVFYEDTDAAGIVYHANYIKYLERARTMFMNELGLPLSKVLELYKVQFLVCNINISFEKPAKLEQTLTVASKINNLGRASVTFEQNVYLDQGLEQRACRAEVALVCTNLNYKPVAIPQEILQELKREG